jgi:hypothetical protein
MPDWRRREAARRLALHESAAPTSNATLAIVPAYLS